MASTSIKLCPYWEGLIKSEVESVRYKNSSEVVLTGLRELEECRTKMNVLCNHLITGYKQAQCGEFVKASAESITVRAKARAAK